MPTNPEPITLFTIVKRAVEITDPDDDDAILGDFLARFEDADEPVTAIDDLDDQLADALSELDPAGANPALAVAAAIVLYLAHRRDELHADPDTILRLTARAEWKGDPPEMVRDLLEDRGISL